MSKVSRASSAVNPATGHMRRSVATFQRFGVGPPFFFTGLTAFADCGRRRFVTAEITNRAVAPADRSLCDFTAAAIFFDSEPNERTRQRLDYAEGDLDRPPRDWRTRQAQANALDRFGKVCTAAAARGRDPWSYPACLRAFIDWLRAHAAVLAAEPDEYRDFLPEFIRADPQGQIEAEIARTEQEIRRLEQERERSRQRERAAARGRLASMRTSDYARLSAGERVEWEGRLGLVLPDDRPAARDALSRLNVPLTS